MTPCRCTKPRLTHLERIRCRASRSSFAIFSWFCCVAYLFKRHRPLIGLHFAEAAVLVLLPTPTCLNHGLKKVQNLSGVQLVPAVAMPAWLSWGIGSLHWVTAPQLHPMLMNTSHALTVPLENQSGIRKQVMHITKIRNQAGMVLGVLQPFLTELCMSSHLLDCLLAATLRPVNLEKQLI